MGLPVGWIIFVCGLQFFYLLEDMLIIEGQAVGKSLHGRSALTEPALIGTIGVVLVAYSGPNRSLTPDHGGHTNSSKATPSGEDSPVGADVLECHPSCKLCRVLRLGRVPAGPIRAMGPAGEAIHLEAVPGQAGPARVRSPAGTSTPRSSGRCTG